MSIKINFTIDDIRKYIEKKEQCKDCTAEENKIEKSIVTIKFEGINRYYSYLNDKFDLKVGDYVYVSGRLSEKAGRVTEIDYECKKNLPYYEKVVSVIETTK